MQRKRLPQRVMIRLSDGTRAALELRAERADLSVSELIRAMIAEGLAARQQSASGAARR
jgi:hypothetical protein